MQRSLGARAGRRQGRVGLGLTKKVIPHRSPYSLSGQIRLGLLQRLHTHVALQEYIARGAAVFSPEVVALQGHAARRSFAIAGDQDQTVGRECLRSTWI